ncbi:DUF350 domain-containing protein [Brevibacillus ginsengisoli]|uniref:DUF350 domain-containing protein n=1 Tax=Brevibacillus ginsengisoli TaxID=363854 RepID=UPI003CFA9E4D
MALFLTYSFLGFLLLIGSILIIPLVTPHHEWKLIKEKNRSAVIVFAGQIYAISNNLYSAIANSVSIPDFLLFGAVAIIWQILLFYLVELATTKIFYKQRFSNLIIENQIEPAILFAVFAVSVSNVISPSLIS